MLTIPISYWNTRFGISSLPRNRYCNKPLAVLKTAAAPGYSSPPLDEGLIEHEGLDAAGVTAAPVTTMPRSSTGNTNPIIHIAAPG